MLTKEFMCAPHYGFGTYAENITHNVGVVANRTDIFDIICIQPQYYFKGDVLGHSIDWGNHGAFSGIVKEAPMVFYAGSTHNLLNNNSLFDAINNFYEV
ncbi:hypothetical protein [Brevibacillus formosus]|uniref:hypothetical protein n=1 Tax=Brevibacillus formosus TaxID=54913 RepID=UPI0012FDA1B5|nr:hypothetical protein [Brevibacillus formosus]